MTTSIMTIAAPTDHTRSGAGCEVVARFISEVLIMTRVTRNSSTYTHCYTYLTSWTTMCTGTAVLIRRAAAR